MVNNRNGRLFKKNGTTVHSSSDTLEVVSKKKSHSDTLSEEWYEISSGNFCYTKSANSPSQTNYSDPDSTPHEFTTLSSESIEENRNQINTAHNLKNGYSELDNYSSVGLIRTPSISVSGVDSVYNRLNSEIVDLSTIVCDTSNDEPIETARNVFYVEHPEEFTFSTADTSYQRNKISSFFNAISSNSIEKRYEDWGIDRSIYTVYSMPGFFADCYNADILFHREYLNHWGMESFAEYRMPLVVCIILTNKEVRKSEVQTSIVPLSVNLLDRYMSKNKNSVAKLVRLVYSKIKSLTSDSSSMSLLTSLGDKFIDYESSYGERPFDIDSSYFELDDTDSNLGDGLFDGEEKTKVNVGIVYNLVAAACYFIGDRYNGLANVSVKALLMQWVSTCKLFTKTKCAAYYIMKNKSVSLSAIMFLMFDIFKTLNYVITTPFVSHMVQSLILCSNDIPFPQNPAQQNIYQKTASVLSRIALIDDTFHKFSTSIITLSIYYLVRKMAFKDKVILNDDKTWLKVDISDHRIKKCTSLLVNTLSQFVNTEMLDTLAQPIDVKHRNEDIFRIIIQGDAKYLDLEGIRFISDTLSSC